MAVRDDFTAGEVLAAADLNDTFGAKIPYAYGTATPSTTVDGFVWYDENETPPAPKFWDGAAFQGIGGGKVLQVVRATDTTDRSTTSTSFVDASLSVTITPQFDTSSVMLIAVGSCKVTWSSGSSYMGDLQITNSANAQRSGAESVRFGSFNDLRTNTGVVGIRYSSYTVIGYDSPATTSATTYKLRFKTHDLTTFQLDNSLNTGQLFAIEVSA